jgi:hypothetical protein
MPSTESMFRACSRAFWRFRRCDCEPVHLRLSAPRNLHIISNRHVRAHVRAWSWSWS